MNLSLEPYSFPLKRIALVAIGTFLCSIHYSPIAIIFFGCLIYLIPMSLWQFLMVFGIGFCLPCACLTTYYWLFDDQNGSIDFITCEIIGLLLVFGVWSTSYGFKKCSEMSKLRENIQLLKSQL